MTGPSHPGDESLDGDEGMVFSVQRYSLQDGPGIRTTVFLKGCSLRCRWCSNPESQNPHPEILFRSQSCKARRACLAVCEVGAISFGDGAPHLDRGLCTGCMDCVKACPNAAFEISGERMFLDEVVEEVCKDELFYTNSGGGVTLSGGEPLCQPEFAYRLLKRCKGKALHTVLDTCGHAPWETLSRLLRYTDLVLYDLKHLDPARHLEGTGVDNDLILENLSRTIDSNQSRVWIRIPVIPDYNDSEAHFRELAAFIQKKPVEKVSLLAYHEWGRSKHAALGREYPLHPTGFLPKERLAPLKEILETAGIDVTIDH
jgi:pyruvate formate lyase activating enzyme